MAQPMTSIPRALRGACCQALALCRRRRRGRRAPGLRVALAQQQSGVVGRIVVQGNERIEPETILSYLPIQVGDTVDPAKIDLALKALFAHRPVLRREDRRCRAAPGGPGGREPDHQPGPVRGQFEHQGRQAARTRSQVRPRGIFTRPRSQEDVGRIVELYRRSGRISATVTPKIVKLPQRRVDLIFEIDEGPKSGILGINFLGNKQFSANDLRDVDRRPRKAAGTVLLSRTTTTTPTGSSTTVSSCASSIATAATTTSASSLRSPSWRRTRTASPSPTRSTRARATSSAS